MQTHLANVKQLSTIKITKERSYFSNFFFKYAIMIKFTSSCFDLREEKVQLVFTDMIKFYS